LKELYAARKLKPVKGECATCYCDCLCPECGGANCIQTSSDAWGDVENSGELFGKAQSLTARNHGQPIITVAFAEVDGEGWQDE
jgi:hypothetical protein